MNFNTSNFTLSIVFFETRNSYEISNGESELLQQVFLLHWDTNIVHQMQKCLDEQVAEYLETDLIANWDLLPDFKFIFKL
uniref:Uncharacterized protein n=1 Tax=Glossina palpalis gambiensis TaxID=67801 RepID=A0A1B0C2J5_9MUSC